METSIINVNKLDFMYRDYLETNHAALEFNEEITKAFTFVGKDDCDAFRLNSPSSFFKFIKESDNTEPHMAVLRCMIPYAIATKLDDYNTGIYILSIVKNHMLVAFRKTLKLSKYTDITFIRPGNKSSIFKESDQYAGIEVRAFLTKRLPNV